MEDYDILDTPDSDDLDSETPDRENTGRENTGGDPPDSDTTGGPQPRAQSLMLAFFGNHVLEEGDRDRCVYSGSIIDVLGRVGVGEQAVRSTLTRMVNRGLLRRRREGRRMYFGLTPQATRVLLDGRTRIWRQGAVNDDWDGTWTLLGFSLPDSWKRRRHDLRSRLTWSGFGALYNGLWIAPGDVDIAGVVAELGLTGHVKIFHARADVATDIELMIRDTWDVEGIAARYVSFDKRWTAHLGAGSAEDPIATRLRLVSDWLRTVRADPRLPARHLPPEWPARPAEDTFRRVAYRTEEPARRMAGALLDTVAPNWPRPAEAGPASRGAFAHPPDGP
ncbi:PaaX family transcriptional regulator C-terminal domain-containing protein [Streptomyces bottropensis]|uniref:Phenylacetic acid degradation operon negative regulatory protein PaaX n=1 Tax=Streptomyces bottropensis ATCC 25435 TaxID=1054862 RepID=M3EWX3_9ACTN|nr:PaaX family transcriptional regulator C-terminal domain-containing protein [Streptomyces bottropensis]EMF53623.1 phenylacetic acid degradation operon negative regulatory protein PaaX [Streptomyces bottropensis ATCC 25435]MZD17634.1 PaaX family transcriptional regulator [Streptomyces sp. SID5476]